jgi:hypothetical protein
MKIFRRSWQHLFLFCMVRARTIDLHEEHIGSPHRYKTVDFFLLDKCSLLIYMHSLHALSKTFAFETRFTFLFSCLRLQLSIDGKVVQRLYGERLFFIFHSSACTED